jgi:uncharacterized protein YecT (DUF1311 family)
MRRYAIYGAFVVLVASGPAVSQSCDGTTAEMRECGAALLERADAELNAVYRQAMTQAKAGGYDDTLRKAQRLWIPYRDAACEAAAAPYQGGTIQPLIRLGCLTDLTETRTKELRSMIFN